MLHLYTCCIYCNCKTDNKYCVCECLAPETMCRAGGQPGIGPQRLGVPLPAAPGPDRRPHLRLAGGIQLPGQQSRMHTRTCAHMHLCTCTHTHAHKHAQKCTQADTYTQAYIHTDTYMHTYIQPHINTLKYTLI